MKFKKLSLDQSTYEIVFAFRLIVVTHIFIKANDLVRIFTGLCTST